MKKINKRCKRSPIQDIKMMSEQPSDSIKFERKANESGNKMEAEWKAINDTPTPTQNLIEVLSSEEDEHIKAEPLQTSQANREEKVPKIKSMVETENLTEKYSEKKDTLVNLKNDIDINLTEKAAIKNPECSDCQKNNSNDIKTDNPKSYQCRLCVEIFTCEQRRNLHERNGHTSPYHCHVCQKVFTLKQNLLRHQQLHEDLDERPYKCGECGRSFTKQTTLENHQNSVHSKSQTWSCYFCDLSFSTKRNLTKHTWTHTKETSRGAGSHHQRSPPLCTTCGRGFRDIAQLRKHERVHTGEKPFTCIECSKSFTCKRELKEHLAAHSDMTPFHCNQCGKSFHTRKRLKRHEGYHREEKLFKCAKCDKAYNNGNQLRTHLQTHGEKQFACAQCDFRCSTAGQLSAHEQSKRHTKNIQEHSQNKNK